ncbi:MAG: YgjV family protein [Oscillospiraceae bacterium]|nr:YgjV family protein [Oscillospiraceae bacterium]
MDILEIIGYFSTALVLVSFLMASVVKLRIINTIGSGIFVVYAILIGSYPTAVMNLGIVCINVYFLVRLLRAEKLTTMLPIETDNAYLKEFMTFYGADMQRFFPEVALEKDTADAAYFVYYDLVPVGVLLGKKQDDGSLRILVDYSTPKYRDASVGRFLHKKLLANEYTCLEFVDPSEKHEKYLHSVGFVKDGNVYRLKKQ